MAWTATEGTAGGNKPDDFGIADANLVARVLFLMNPGCSG
ncbi:hypothetical protein EV130_110286 [Rhizobium azibense]|uniref:Uncharacterized protein n=1 Tax=Rhizobium azibense TaxID=1136135 RepID=A0A4R3RP03_9HYPH|nr:hypothetical protein EV130_110286 [Rhizobium azibense]TCU33256.1 hypothetical protein EV129_11614 [Rhizobium azibense]